MNSNKTIVVTGASSGIGLATAQKLLMENYSVVVTARREEVLKEYFEGYNNCTIIPYDLSEIEGVLEYTKIVYENVGAIAGLVHCAGVGIGNIVTMIKPKLMKELFDVNTFAGMLLVSGFSKHKRVESNASFILLSSIAAHAGSQGQSVYSATKGALEGFVKGSAAELAAKGIRINALAPGLVMTDLVKNHYAKLDENTVNDLTNGYPLGTGRPADIADFAEYLISASAARITGQTFILDGGFMVRKP